MWQSPALAGMRQGCCGVACMPAQLQRQRACWACNWACQGLYPVQQQLCCSHGLPQVPLNITIREQSDAGAPIVAVQPDSAAAQAYVSVAERVWAKLQAGGGSEGGAQPHGPPKIVFE